MLAVEIGRHIAILGIAAILSVDFGGHPLQHAGPDGTGGAEDHDSN